MIKVFAQTILGLVIAFAGIVLFYLYIINLNEGSNLLYIIGSIPLVGGGAFILFRAGGSDASVTKTKVAMPNLQGKFSDESGLDQRIQKNNDLTKDWKKTDDARNRLRMLELAGDTNDQ
jgi:hypothetical protein